MSIQGFGAGLGGFAAYILAAVVIIRVLRVISPAVLVLAAAWIVYGAMLILLPMVGAVVHFWATSITYWFLTLCFLMAFGAIYKSVSLRVLRDLLKTEGRSQSHDAILARYIREESYQRRLALLESEGFALRQPEGYVLTPKGNRLAGVAHVIQRVFRIERSG